MRQWEDLQSLHIHTLFNMCQPDVILMQYTGLKDENGIEIYEGDILKHPSGDIGTVNWMEYMAQYRVIYQDDHDLAIGLQLGEKGQAVVIGNIYENSELLSV